MKRDELFEPPKKGVMGSVLSVGILTLIGMITIGVCAVRGVRTAPSAVIDGATLLGIMGACLLLHVWLHRLARRTKPERLPIVHAGVMLSSIVTVYMIFGLVLYSSMFGMAEMYAFLIPVTVGITLVHAGITRREGESMHCPICEYEHNFAEADGPERCPECGTGWLGRLKKGRKKKATKLIGWGIGVIIGGTVLMQPWLFFSWAAGLMPTPMLYTLLYISPKQGYRAWSELAKRPLASPWDRVMAERVISARRRASSFMNVGGSWFESAGVQASLPAGVKQRYYGGSVEADVSAPATVKAGEEFEVAVRVRRVTRGEQQVGMYFGGYWIGDAGPVGRQPKTLWAHELGPSDFFGSHRDVLVERLAAPRTAGPCVVRATYWVVFVPSFWERLQWQADGTPAVPPGATSFERVDLERTVEVE
ncbi:MAG: hypothetical protein AB7G11_08130 [Phycisphaerales bacterium]